MAKRLAIPSEHVKVKIVGPADSFFASRLQRITLGGDIPTTDVYELGSNTLAGTVQDTPNITVTFSAFDVGVKIFSVLTGENPAAYPASGVNISNLGEADVIVYIRDESVSDYAKSIHGKRLQVRDFSFNYSVDGESTEDYTLIGSEKRVFKNDVIVDRFTTGTTSFTLSQTPIVLKNGNYALSVILDGEYLEETSSTPGTGEYRISGTTLTTGDIRTSQVIAVYHANPSGDNWDYISDEEVPAAIRGRDVNVVIAANDIKRVQSVTINGNLNVQAVREMGSRNIIGYQRQTPTVEGTITVLDTDTELIDLLTSGSINSGATEFEFGQGCVASGVKMVIELVDPCDSSTPYTVLKSIEVPDIVIVGDSWTGTVNQNSTWNINYRSNTAQCIIYSGAIP